MWVGVYLQLEGMFQYKYLYIHKYLDILQGVLEELKNFYMNKKRPICEFTYLNDRFVIFP